MLRNGYKILALLSVITMLFSSYLFFGLDVRAAGLSNLTLPYQRINSSYSVNFFRFNFDLSASNAFTAGETIVVVFKDGYRDLTSYSNTEPEDFAITVNGVNETVVSATGCSTNDAIAITSIDKVAAGTDTSPADGYTDFSNVVGFADGDTVTFTFTACTSYTAGPTGSTITVAFGGFSPYGGLAGATAYMRNPFFPGTYDIDFTAAGDDTTTYTHVVRNGIEGVDGVATAQLTASPSTESTAATYTIAYSVPPAHTPANTGYMTITLGDGYVSSGTWEAADFKAQYTDSFDVLQDFDIKAFTRSTSSMPAESCTGTGADDIEILMYDPPGGSPTFKIANCDSFVYPGDAPKSYIYIYGTSTTGTGVLTSPDGTSSPVISSFHIQSNDPRGSFDEYIYQYFNNSVSVSATVDPVITVSLESTLCDLGNLTTASLSACEFGFTFLTNGTGGMNIYIENVTPGGFGLVNQYNDEIPLADGLITSGTKESGWASDLGNDTATGLTSVACSDKNYETEAACTGASATWSGSYCSGTAVDTQSECNSIGGWYLGGDTCAFTDRTSCEGLGGTWYSACEVAAATGTSRGTDIGTSGPFSINGGTIDLNTFQFFDSQGADVTVNLCFTAGIDAITPAGSYVHQTRFTGVGSF